MMGLRYWMNMAVVCALLLWVSSHSSCVVSGSMEPGIKRGDLLFFQHLTSASDHPIRAGDIILFKSKAIDIPIVHRVVTVHEQRRHQDAGSHHHHGHRGGVDVLTKGDNNGVDDRMQRLYAGQWLQRQSIIGKVVGILPYVGWLLILMTENKYILPISLLVWLSSEMIASKLSWISAKFHVLFSCLTVRVQAKKKASLHT